MALTLLSGRTAAGKTQRLVDLATERYRSDPFAQVLVLVPTARHADQFRQRLVADAGVAFGLDVTTINLFSARHLDSANVASRDLADELLTRVTRDRALADGAATRFLPIVSTAGFRRLVAAAVGELSTAAVEPKAFAVAAAATTDLDLRGLADIYTAYSAGLAAHGWVHPAASPQVAAKNIAHSYERHLVLIDGIQFLRAGELAIVTALARQTEVWLAIGTDAGERATWTRSALHSLVPELQEETLVHVQPATTLLAATTADAEAQLREIARSIKSRLTDEPSLRPSDFAVAFRQVSAHLALARRVFREYRLPLDCAAGERLAERPFGAWLLRLLRTGVHGWRTLDALDVLGAGYVEWSRWGIQPGHLERLRRLARRGQWWSGADSWNGLAASARTEADGRANPGLRAAADAWESASAAIAALVAPETLRTPGEHASALDEGLFGAAGIVRVDVPEYESLAVEIDTLRREFASIRAVDEALGSAAVPFHAFVDAIETRMQRPSTLLREAGGVLLAPMHTLHGLRFEHVYVAGLSEGEFPASSRTGELLDREARAALKDAGLELPPPARAAEDELWRTAISRATRSTSLWRPRLDASGRPSAASYYFNLAAHQTPGVVNIDSAADPERAASTRELAIGLTQRWPVDHRRPIDMPAWSLVVRTAASIEQRRRSFAVGGRHEGEVPGVDMRRLTAPETVWSASRLQSYRTCPFQFFAQYGLGLYELDEELGEADAAIRGTVMHEMLEDAFTPLIEGDLPFDDAGLAVVIERLRGRGRAIWDQAPAKHAFGRVALWQYQGDAAIRDLELLLQREAAINAQLGMRRVIGGERKFAHALPFIDPPLVVEARVDRIDQSDDAIQIVDYKTGKTISRADLVNGQQLQLQLYAMVAGLALGTEHLIARYSFLRNDRADWWLDSERDEDAQLLGDAPEIAREVRDSVAAGMFEVSPQVPICPGYCSFITMCRVNAFSRSKTWR